MYLNLSKEKTIFNEYYTIIALIGIHVNPACNMMIYVHKLYY